MTTHNPLRRRCSTLVLGLGNEIMGDDAAGLLAARQIGEFFRGSVDVVESRTAGYMLLELLSGYERVLILDSCRTQDHKPGTLVEFNLYDHPEGVAASAHFFSLSEVLELARRLSLDMPRTIRAIGLEIADPFVLSDSMTSATTKALPLLIEQGCRIISDWSREPVPEDLQTDPSPQTVENF